MIIEITKGSVFRNVKELLRKLKMEYNAEYNVVIYTSIGRVVCDIEPPATESSLFGFTDDPTAFTLDISAIFDGKDIFPDHIINAKNVIVYGNDSSDEIMRTDQMLIFADQIVGFSFARKH